MLSASQQVLLVAEIIFEQIQAKNNFLNRQSQMPVSKLILIHIAQGKAADLTLCNVVLHRVESLFSFHTVLTRGSRRRSIHPRLGDDGLYYFLLSATHPQISLVVVLLEPGCTSSYVLSPPISDTPSVVGFGQYTVGRLIKNTF